MGMASLLKGVLYVPNGVLHRVDTRPKTAVLLAPANCERVDSVLLRRKSQSRHAQGCVVAPGAVMAAI